MKNPLGLRLAAPIWEERKLGVQRRAGSRLEANLQPEALVVNYYHRLHDDHATEESASPERWQNVSNASRSGHAHDEVTVNFRDARVTSKQRVSFVVSAPSFISVDRQILANDLIFLVGVSGVRGLASLVPVDCEYAERAAEEPSVLPFPITSLRRSAQEKEQQCK